LKGWTEKEEDKIREIITKTIMLMVKELGSEYIVSFEANFKDYPAFVKIEVKKYCQR